MHKTYSSYQLSKTNLTTKNSKNIAEPNTENVDISRFPHLVDDPETSTIKIKNSPIYGKSKLSSTNEISIIIYINCFYHFWDRQPLDVGVGVSRHLPSLPPTHSPTSPPPTKPSCLLLTVPHTHSPHCIIHRYPSILPPCVFHTWNAYGSWRKIDYTGRYHFVARVYIYIYFFFFFFFVFGGFLILNI